MGQQWKRKESQLGFHLLHRTLLLTSLVLSLLGIPVAIGVRELENLAHIQEGSNAVIPFYQELPPDYSLHPYYTLSLGHGNHPFCSDGNIDPRGLLGESQSQRFSVSASKTNHSLLIKLSIESACSEDQGIYTANVLLFGKVRHPPLVQQMRVNVYTPRGKAHCFFTHSQYSDRFKEAHCRAATGESNATLSCFQGTRKVPYKGGIYTEGGVVMGIFWVTFDTPISCCSHDSGKNISKEVCNDFIWPLPEVKRNQAVTSMRRVTSNSHDHDESVPSTPVESGSISTHQVHNTHCFLCACFLIVIASLRLWIND